ncbi:MAG: indole-3-glycerol phosphate synthase TrpC [Alphaproteobacteria bacterium]|nr:indole-3-glycerol phosphate synthase TrpC [Alphaproteobacteria bacterium]
MGDILQKICADKRAHIETARLSAPFEEVHRAALRSPPPRGFSKALRQKAEIEGKAFIAEIKKASPSAGLLRPTYKPEELARSYAEAGAACLSVLTDAPYFQGQNEDLIEARAACPLPVLRKDFIVDEWQVAESRAIGADCILLIMAALEDEMAERLHRQAFDYGMDVLIETHDREELERALALSSPLIGVNSRNLKTLKIDLPAASELIRSIPPERFAVSESGLRTKEDLAAMQTAGARGFLIGESLLKQSDAGAALKKLRE